MINLHVKLVLTFSVVLLSACAPTSVDPIAFAKSTIKQRLKDPDSSRFGDIYVVERNPDSNGIKNICVCGVVDGRNSFNAYTGGSRFVVSLMSSGSQNTPAIAFAEIEDGSKKAVPRRINEELATKFEHIYWNTSCVDASHTPTFTGNRD
jgi:hypothetical protein